MRMTGFVVAPNSSWWSEKQNKNIVLWPQPHRKRNEGWVHNWDFGCHPETGDPKGSLMFDANCLFFWGVLFLGLASCRTRTLPTATSFHREAWYTGKKDVSTDTRQQTKLHIHAITLHMTKSKLNKSQGNSKLQTSTWQGQSTKIASQPEAQEQHTGYPKRTPRDYQWSQRSWWAEASKI